MNNILILTDFSPAAQNAVEFGYQLALQLHSNITLCNVMNIPAEIPQFEVPVLPLSGYDHMVEESERDLFRLKAHFDELSAAQSYKPEINCLEEVGRVTDTVLRLAVKHQVELVLMGAHQRKGMVEWLLSNHVNELIEVAKIPVIVIPPDAKVKKIGKVAIALHNPIKKEKELNQAYELSERLKADLFLFRIEDNNAENEIAEKAQLRTILKTIKTTLKIYLRTALNGPVEKQLKSLCDSETIDLLVMIHQKRSFIHDLLLTGHSQKMSAHTSIPLMIIPSHPA